MENQEKLKLNREQRRALEKKKRSRNKQIMKVYDKISPEIKQEVYKRMYEKIAALVALEEKENKENDTIEEN